jgi:flagellar biosynthesis protein FlhB
MSERTHDPTPKRLRDARAKGDVPQAPLVAGALGAIALAGLGRGLIEDQARDLARSMATLAPVTTVDGWDLAWRVIAPVARIAVVLAAIAIAAAIVQGSVTFSPGRLAPDPSKLDPVSGFGKLLEKGRLWAAARGLLSLIVLSWLLGRAAVAVIANGARATGHPSALFGIAAEGAGRSVLIAGGVACALAVIDAIVGRRIWLGRLKMTRDEVVREHKEGDGDPEIKRRREELHQELLAAEAIGSLRDATVVVVNPTHLACALRYDRSQSGEDGGDDDLAPTLITKAEGALAAKIVAAAKAQGIPIIRDVPVARALYELEVGTEIPEALYEVVAEVLRAAWEGEGD